MSSAARSFAIIPACGESRRMGTDKLLLRWKDSTILETVIAAWQASQVDHIFVVIPQSRTELQKLLQVLPVHIVLADPRPVDMKGSIQVALRMIQEPFEPTSDDTWLIAPADMPTLSTATIDQVLKVAANMPGQIVRPSSGGKHGHPALFPWKLTEEVFNLAEHEGLNVLAQRYPPFDVTVEELGEDVDTPEDLKQLQTDQSIDPSSK
ncbi:hypothetical protein C5Y96_22505 [Blastopirellula marina]|uniref:MobA-like NTP transferase domain-containing protein n=1 Tax=Blastopirellula marina TaxID=124 RepID=A0A2S8F212_9BACT|nr:MULTISPECIES: nucleotidyltransferase family protein [Pirellulaceae]PQO26212.1 hypothetical protein C5Y96_22505 [Blastopirellula marina]RCS44571.1 nucleotidyltransferase family protein [Bremerella cremea]